MLSDFLKSIQQFVGKAKIRLLDQSSFPPLGKLPSSPPQLGFQMFWREKTGNVPPEELQMSDHQGWHHKNGLADLALTVVVTDISSSGSRLRWGLNRRNWNQELDSREDSSRYCELCFREADRPKRDGSSDRSVSFIRAVKIGGKSSIKSLVRDNEILTKEVARFWEKMI